MVSGHPAVICTSLRRVGLTPLSQIWDVLIHVNSFQYCKICLGSLSIGSGGTKFEIFLLPPDLGI